MRCPCPCLPLPCALVRSPPLRRIARQRPTDPQICPSSRTWRTELPAAHISVPFVPWQVLTTTLSFSDDMTWRMPKELALPSSRSPRTGRCAKPPLARGAARGAAAPKPAPLPLVDLPDQPTRGHLCTGVVADVCRRGSLRGGRGGLSSPPLRVDSGAAMLRATRPGGGRRNDLTSCSGAQVGWPLRGRAQASYPAAGQPRGAIGKH